MADKIRWVTMRNKNGQTVHGVHPDAVSAHEAIGYVVVAEPEKAIEVEEKVADAEELPVSEKKQVRRTAKN